MRTATTEASASIVSGLSPTASVGIDREDGIGVTVATHGQYGRWGVVFKMHIPGSSSRLPSEMELEKQEQQSPPLPTGWGRTASLARGAVVVNSFLRFGKRSQKTRRLERVQVALYPVAAFAFRLDAYCLRQAGRGRAFIWKRLHPVDRTSFDLNLTVGVTGKRLKLFPWLCDLVCRDRVEDVGATAFLDPAFVLDEAITIRKRL
jgi:hypothetical protein